MGGEKDYPTMMDIMRTKQRDKQKALHENAPGQKQNGEPVGTDVALAGDLGIGAHREPVVVKRREGVHLLTSDEVAVLTVEEAAAAVGVARVIEAQRQLIRPPELVDELAPFATRLHEALERANGPLVSVELSAREQQVATFLVGQTRARRDLSWRVRHVCVDCGKATLSNPAFDKIRERNRKIMALSRTGGAAISPVGVTPFFMISSVMAFVKLEPDYHCPSCFGMQDEESIVVFCPGCKTLHTEAILGTCACGHVFKDPAETMELWEAKATALPAPSREASAVPLGSQPVDFAYAAAARIAVVVGEDGWLEAWSLGTDAEGGEPLWRMEVGAGKQVAISDGGEFVAFTADTPGDLYQVTLLDGRTGGILREIEQKGPGSLTSLAFSPDGAWLAVATYVVHLFKIPEGVLAETLKMGRGWMSGPGKLAFSPDGSRLASDGSMSTFVWDLEAGMRATKLRQISQIKGLRWTPDGQGIAMVGNKRAAVCELSGDSLAEIELEGQGTCVAISPGGGLLATACEQGPVQVFDLLDGRESSAIEAGEKVVGLAFDTDERLVVASAGGLKVWSLS